MYKNIVYAKKWHRRKNHYIVSFEDGSDYHYRFDGNVFSRINITSTGLNSYFIKNGKFPTGELLREIDDLAVSVIKDKFAKEIKQNQKARE